MTAGQRWGVATAGTAFVAWAAVGIMIVTSGSEGGANIGAGMVALLAIAVSFAAAGVLFAAARSTTARVAAVTCAAFLSVFLLAAPTEGLTDALLFGLLVASLIALAVAAVATAFPRGASADAAASPGAR